MTNPSIPVLSTLENSGLIRLVQMEPELEYLFRHALVQEATYESILKSDRKSLHLAVAREVEKLYPDRLDDMAALLAHHYREADHPQTAYQYYRRAAKHAFTKFANREGLYNTLAAIELCTDENELPHLHLRSGGALQNLGQMAEAEERYLVALPLFRAQNDLDQIAFTYTQLANVRAGQNDIAGAQEYARAGLQEVGELPPSANYAELLRIIGNQCVFSNQIEEAEEMTRKAMACAEACNAHPVLAQALITQALIEDRRGHYDQARAVLEHVIELSEREKIYHAISRARNNLAFIYARQGKNEAAAAQYTRMVEINRSINSIIGEIWALTQLNSLYLELGKIRQAVQLAEEIRAMLDASGGRVYRAMAMQSILQTMVYTGRGSEILPDLQKECELALERDDRQLVMVTRSIIALTHAMQNNYADAAEELVKGLTFSGVWASSWNHFALAAYRARGGMELSLVYAAFEQGQRTRPEKSFYDDAAQQHALMCIRARENDLDAALEIAQKLVQMHHSVGSRWAAAHILHEAGDFAQEAGQPGRAQELYQCALDEYEAMEIPLLAEQVRNKLNDPR